MSLYPLPSQLKRKNRIMGSCKYEYASVSKSLTDTRNTLNFLKTICTKENLKYDF